LGGRPIEAEKLSLKRTENSRGRGRGRGGGARAELWAARVQLQLESRARARAVLERCMAAGRRGAERLAQRGRGLGGERRE
jgi:hypothetical protein